MSLFGFDPYSLSKHEARQHPTSHPKITFLNLFRMLVVLGVLAILAL